MANTDFPMGFEPVYMQAGGELQDVLHSIADANDAIYPGDIVELHTDGYARACGSATPTRILGIANEYKAASAGGTIAYTPACANLIMRAQVDSADVDVQGDLELSYAINYTTGDTTTLRSKMEIAGATSHATDYAVFILRVADSRNSVANALGEFVTVECKFNPSVTF